MTSLVVTVLASAAAAGSAADRGASWGKLNPYIECLNSASPQVRHGARLYGRWVDLEKGPTGKEKVVLGTLSLAGSAIDSCTRNVAATTTRAPRRPELEQAGNAYANALVELQAHVNEAYDYYHQGDYKDDRMARGKAMHPVLMQAWERFGAADTALRKQVASVADRLERDDLAALEKRGPRLAYLAQKAMLEGKRLAQLLDDEGAAADRLAAAVEALQTATAAVGAQLATEKLDISDRSQVERFVTAAKDLVASAKELVRHRRSGKKYDSILLENNPELVDGHPAQVMQKYNDLVDRMNWLHRGGVF